MCWNQGCGWGDGYPGWDGDGGADLGHGVGRAVAILRRFGARQRAVLVLGTRRRVLLLRRCEVLVAFEGVVLTQRLLHELMQTQGRQLQDLDRLDDLRRHPHALFKARSKRKLLPQVSSCRHLHYLGK